MTPLLKVCTVATLLLLALVADAQAFWDKSFKTNFIGDGGNDVQAYSDLVKHIGEHFAEIFDSVSVLKGAPDELQQLSFDWGISAGHRIKGPLPFAGQWMFINKWTTFRWPIHADFELGITPIQPAGEQFIKTATAHEPFPSIENVLSAIEVAKPGAPADASISGRVGGAMSMVSSRDPFSDPPADPNGGRTPINALDYINNFSDVLNNPILDAAPWLEVFAEVSSTDSMNYVYSYFAANSTNSSITGTWIGYSDSVSSAITTRPFSVGPQSVSLLDTFVSTGQPWETNGLVSAQVQGQTFVFFAPSLVAIVPAPPTLVLLAVGLGSAFISGWMRSKRNNSDGPDSRDRTVS